MSESSTNPLNKRWHDLDALRGFAMLLGIVLHAALPFVPDLGWFFEDEKKHDGIYLIYAAIHGFRMPLFFLLSGFFAAMLLKKKGIRFYTQHRFKRIVLPLIIFSILIGTLSDKLIENIVAKEIASTQKKINVENTETIDFKVIDATQDKEQLNGLAEKSIRNNDIESLKMILGKGIDVNRLNNINAALMHWAAAFDNTEAISLLYKSKANLNILDREKNTPLMWATFYGKTNAVKKLVELGANTELKNQDGVRPIDLASANSQDLAGLIITFANLLIIPVELDALKANYKTNLATLKTKSEAPSTPTDVAPPLHHLWFLLYLAVLIFLYGFIDMIISPVLNSKRLRFLIFTPVKYLWLVPCVLFFQYDFDFEAFGPDTSATWRPETNILGYYGIFFLFGALAFNLRKEGDKLGRFWFISLPLAFLIFFIGLALIFDSEYSGEGKYGDDSKLAASLCITLYTCLMSFGLIGLFNQIASRGRKWVRYLSDSSYWLYIAHLPLTYYIGYEVKSIDINPYLKLALICGIVFLILLISYRLFVRYTFIGTLLNGKKVKKDLKGH